MKAAAVDRKPKMALGAIALIAVVFVVLLVVYGGQVGVSESPRPVLLHHHQAKGPAVSTAVATVTCTTQGTVVMSGDVLSNAELMQASGTVSE